MKVGIIGSSGGSALATAMSCLENEINNIEIYVVTDRECGMLEWAAAKQYKNILIPYTNAEEFSEKALNFFQKNEVTDVLLLYTRKIASPLIGTLPTYNLHPSLLPMFKGMNALKDAIRSNMRMIGCTLHVVDLLFDNGAVVAQICNARPLDGLFSNGQKISYLQKVYLILVFFENLKNQSFVLNLKDLSFEFRGEIHITTNSTPALINSTIIKNFKKIENLEGVSVIA